jgi:septation ring formation regulator EzrA
MQELSQEEMLLYGFKSPSYSFTLAKDFFEPYFQLWSTGSDLLNKKRSWMETQKLIDMRCDEVEDTLRKAEETVKRLKKKFTKEAKALKVIS